MMDQHLSIVDWIGFIGLLAVIIWSGARVASRESTFLVADRALGLSRSWRRSS